MKKMITCLAALAIIAAAPATAAFAADPAPAEVSVTAEMTVDRADIRNLIGQWKYQVAEDSKNVTAGITDNGIIIVNEDRTYTYTDTEGNTNSGTVELKYEEYSNGDKVPYFAFYNGEEFFIGCYCRENETDPDLYYIGNGGIAQLIRDTKEQEEENGSQEITDEKGADKKEIAAARMEDFNTIMAIMNASPMYTVVDAVVNDHVLVTDGRFTTVDSFKEFISETLTGDLRDRFIKECDDCFTEKDGSLYVKTVGRSYFSFNTEQGAEVIDPAMDHFAAVTMGGSELFGYGKAVYDLDDGKWKISGYEYGEWRDIMAVGDYDLSSVTGMWYEDIDISYCVLNIRFDETFSFSYDGGIEFGVLKPVYWLNENGEKVIGVELVSDRNGCTIGTFAAPEKTPCVELWLNRGEISTRYILHDESQEKYTVDELAEMAANDYEERTGIRPAYTQPMINSDASVTIAMYDENTDPIDAYILDQNTGVGQLHSDKSEVDLPQTGNNSLGTAGAAAAAVLLTVAGAFAVGKSGMLRRKENE